MGERMTWMGGKDGNFPLTEWTLVHRAGAGEGDVRRRVLGRLIRAYWKPLYCLAFFKGAKNEEAKDLVQGFFASLLERDVLAQFDPKEGRFRTYLRACFENYCADEHDRRKAEKRGGGNLGVRLDGRAEDSVREIEGKGLTPEQAYHLAWAREKLQRAFERVRKGLEADGKTPSVKILEGFLAARDAARPGYAKLAAESGLSEDGVRHALERVKRLLEQAFLDEIRPETGSDEETREELSLLLQWLGRR